MSGEKVPVPMDESGARKWLTYQCPHVPSPWIWHQQQALKLMRESVGLAGDKQPTDRRDEEQ